MTSSNDEGSPCDKAVNVLDCDDVVNEFEFQSNYYVHFRTNTFEKGMNHQILHLDGYCSST